MIKSEELLKGWLGTGAKKEEPDEGVTSAKPEAKEEELEEESLPQVDEAAEDPHMNDFKEPPVKSITAALAQSGLGDIKPVASTSYLDTKLEPEADDKKDVKVRKKDHFLVLVGTYSIGKERIVKGI